MSASVSGRDVERIARDVLAASGLDLTLLRADAITAGWQVTVKDVADRLFSVELPAGPPAVIRSAMQSWVDGI
jgi:hypothetical protein